MYEKHRTSDGITLYISQMDDKHLKNTINMALRRISTLKNTAVTVELPAFKQALYDVTEEELNFKQAEKLRKEVEKLYPYLAEAMLRGIPYTEALQQVFERKGQEGGTNVLVVLPLPEEEPAS